MCVEMRAWAGDEHSEGRSLGDAVPRISARASGCDMLEIWVGAWVEMRSIRGERRRRGKGHERGMLLDPLLAALLILLSLICSPCSLLLSPTAVLSVCVDVFSPSTSRSCQRGGGRVREFKHEGRARSAGAQSEAALCEFFAARVDSRRLRYVCAHRIQ